VADGLEGSRGSRGRGTRRWARGQGGPPSFRSRATRNRARRSHASWAPAGDDRRLPRSTTRSGSAHQSGRVLLMCSQRRTLTWAQASGGSMPSASQQASNDGSSSCATCRTVAKARLCPNGRISPVPSASSIPSEPPRVRAPYAGARAGVDVGSAILIRDAKYERAPRERIALLICDNGGRPPPVEFHRRVDPIWRQVIERSDEARPLT
jgi:hypothetical protein